MLPTGAGRGSASDGAVPFADAASEVADGQRMIELGLKVTLAYLVGSVLGSLLVGFFYGGVDIRKAGSAFVPPALPLPALRISTPP